MSFYFYQFRFSPKPRSCSVATWGSDLLCVWPASSAQQLSSWVKTRNGSLHLNNFPGSFPLPLVCNLRKIHHSVFPYKWPCLQPYIQQNRTEFCVSPSMFHGTLVTAVTRYTGFCNQVCLGNAESYKVTQSSTVFFCESLKEDCATHPLPNSFAYRTSFFAFSSKHHLGLVSWTILGTLRTVNTIVMMST